MYGRVGLISRKLKSISKKCKQSSSSKSIRNGIAKQNQEQLNESAMSVKIPMRHLPNLRLLLLPLNENS